MITKLDVLIFGYTLVLFGLIYANMSILQINTQVDAFLGTVSNCNDTYYDTIPILTTKKIIENIPKNSNFTVIFDK